MVSLLMVIALNLRRHQETIDVEALKSIGLYPGPKYQVKSYDNFEYEGQVYNSDDFKGPAKPDQLYPSLVIQNHVSLN